MTDIHKQLHKWLSKLGHELFYSKKKCGLDIERVVVGGGCNDTTMELSLLNVNPNYTMYSWRLSVNVSSSNLTGIPKTVAFVSVSYYDKLLMTTKYLIASSSGMLFDSNLSSSSRNLKVDNKDEAIRRLLANIQCASDFINAIQGTSKRCDSCPNQLQCLNNKIPS